MSFQSTLVNGSIERLSRKQKKCFLASSESLFDEISCGPSSGVSSPSSGVSSHESLRLGSDPVTNPCLWDHES